MTYSAKMISRLIVLCIGFTILGCGPGEPPSISRTSVKGKLLAADGSPIPHGKVIFIAPQDVMYGDTPFVLSKDGTFGIEMKDGVGGIAVGDYKVVVDITNDSSGKPYGDLVSKVPAKFQKAASTTLEAKLGSGENNIELKLTK